MRAEEVDLSRSVGVWSLRLLWALGLAAAGPAQAQYFISNGVNDSFPTNLFPIDPANPLADFTGNTVRIGDAAPGSFSALAGALLKADALIVGSGLAGSGSATVTGAGARVQLGGTGNRFQIGNWGSGSMTVSAGGVVDATVNAASCLASSTGCYNFVGNGAGSTGTLNITGAGSQVSLLRGFVVGNAQVFTQARDGFDFGTPGGTTNAIVQVLNGGTLRTQTTTIGQGATGSSALGTERALAGVIVDGPGSQWIATRNTVDNTIANFVVGSGKGANATVTASNGGKLIVDGTGGSATSFDSFQVGVNGGIGAVTITGTGSGLQVLGNNPFVVVGAGANSQGTLSIVSGATASALAMGVGRVNGTGTLLIDGAGSQLSLVGVGTNGVQSSGGVSIGQTGGTGTATVSHGGLLLIGDGGADSRVPYSGFTGNPYINIGREAASTGTLNITDAGSTVRMTSSSLGLAAGVPDNYNPFVSVGRFSGSTGFLNITNGGQLVMQGNAVSTVTDSRTTGLFIGGVSDTAAGGTGTALVSGLGSAISMSGSDTFIGIGLGAGANGQLTIANQGAVSVTDISVGRSGGVGNLAMDNGALTMSGQQTGNNLSAAGLFIGQGGGTGTATLANGSRLSITNPGLAGANLTLGGTTVFPTGNGTLTVSGASTINIAAASGLASFTVGRDGTGVASFSQGSSIDIGDGTTHVGRLAGSNGSLTLASGSILNAGVIGIGGSSDTVAGGTGNAFVSGAGSALNATGTSAFISVGRSGNGSLAVSNQGSVTGTILNVGRAAGGVGTLTVDNGTLNLSGQQASGVGAAFSIGNLGGNGTATLTNNSVVTLSNLGTGGAHLNVGGTSINPLGTGTLSVTDSRISLLAQPGQAGVTVGYDGKGTATFTNSSLNVGDGSLVIGALAGSNGSLTLGAGSVASAGFVGIGQSQTGVGGTANLILDNSTVNATSVYIGAGGTLSGDNGVINATGNVTVAGTISPGHSPGRVNINCNFITLAGSQLILDVLDTGAGFDVDHLILGNDSTFDLSKIQLVFNFLGSTDPNAFAAAGGFQLDNFLESLDLATGVVSGLSSVFAPGTTWSDLVSSSQFTAVSSAYDVSNLSLMPDGTVAFTTAPVPEPGTWALLLFGLALLGAVARRRHR